MSSAAGPSPGSPSWLQRTSRYALTPRGKLIKPCLPAKIPHDRTELYEGIVEPAIPRALRQLQEPGLPPLAALGEPLRSVRNEVAPLWRFSRTNDITEGSHNTEKLPQWEDHSLSLP